ncbi:alpha/beta fold hydrolase [Almyronema epifaneia]|uniref:Alpha/beta fold hydrolase n=1 Tax=Almyronema epifaneia S1 TaxID=2991925 RepID=A0ABW6IGP1_9CYAN
MSLKTIQLKTYQAAYRQQGQGTPLIFLHGFLGSSANWQPIMSQLPLDYPCIALDLLGFGGSSQPPLKYTIWHQVAFLQEFIAALDLQAVHLVGHSYGGWVAAAYAIAASGYTWAADYSRWLPPTAADPRLISPARLSLVAPAGIRDDSFVGRYTYLRPLLWQTPLIDWILSAIAPLARLCHQEATFAQIYRARTELLKQPVARSFLTDRLTPTDAIDTVEPYLGAIAAPTQIIAGELDSTIPLWHCQTYAAGIPQAQLTVLPQAEHDLIQTHSKAIAQLITQPVTP